MFSTSQLQDFSELTTPFYYYDMELLRETLETVKSESSRYGYHVHYAVKANSNHPILRLAEQHGLGADCVSGNEIQRSIECGFDPSNIVFAGVGKSDDEIKLALQHDIFCFNCESIEEILVINELAADMGKIARIALRINPNVNAYTHEYITTGLEENKFGINQWEFEEVLIALQNSTSIIPIGFHFHIGSQITDLSVFKNLCTRVNEIQEWFSDRQLRVQHVNVGGGLGINYHAPDEEPIVDFKSFFALFNDFLDLRPGQELHFELGRSITGHCGTLFSKVLYVKKGIQTNFAILDAGMTDLIRPALYQSYHKIENVSSTESETVYDVVGPICESSDCFGKRVHLPKTNRGDLIAIRSTGAYGQIMASDYNLRNRAEAVYSQPVKSKVSAQLQEAVLV
jgi:diaminopimelate decarboxylase